MLLEKVPRRANNWFEVFVDVLEKCGMEDLAKNLDIPVVQRMIPWSTRKRATEAAQTYKLPVDEYITPTLEIEKQASTRRPLPSPSESERSARYKPLPKKHEISKVPTIGVSSSCPNDCNYEDEINDTECSELEHLRHRRNTLMRIVEEKKEIKSLRLEVEALERTLKSLDEGTEEVEKITTHKDKVNRLPYKQTSDIETMTDLLLEDFGRNVTDTVIALKSKGTSTSDKAVDLLVAYIKEEMEKLKKYVTDEIISTLDCARSSCDLDRSGSNVLQNESIRTLMSFMKEEVAKLKDYVTDGLLNTFTCSRSCDSPGDQIMPANSCPTLGSDWNVRQGKVILYSAARPRPHMVLDSGVCSSYYDSGSTEDYRGVFPYSHVQ